MHIWQDDLIEQPLEIAGGYMKVPDGPGLGVALDEAAVERLRLPDQSKLPTRPKRSYAVSWPAGTAPGAGGKGVPAGSGTVDGFESDLFREYGNGNFPRFPGKVRLEQVVHSG
jgi:hypothetical protein